MMIYEGRRQSSWFRSAGKERRESRLSSGDTRHRISASIAAILLVTIAGLSAGCGRDAFSQDFALQCAIKSGQVDGVTPRDIPWNQIEDGDDGDGEFSKVNILNVRISLPDYTTRWWSVVFGLSRANNQWEIIRVAQWDRSKTWKSLPVLPSKEESPAAPSGWFAFSKQVPILKAAIKEGRIPEVKEIDREKSVVFWSYPEPHKGEFAKVSIRNLNVGKSDGTLKHWSVVFGKSRSDDNWKAIRVAECGGDDTWHDLLIE